MDLRLLGGWFHVIIKIFRLQGVMPFWILASAFLPFDALLIKVRLALCFDLSDDPTTCDIFHTGITTVHLELFHAGYLKILLLQLPTQDSLSDLFWKVPSSLFVQGIHHT